ncbi:MAG: hypothetical protein AAGF79_19555, partial [Pseudomonadota bacterium]
TINIMGETLGLRDTDAVRTSYTERNVPADPESDAFLFERGYGWARVVEEKSLSFQYISNFGDGLLPEFDLTYADNSASNLEMF